MSEQSQTTLGDYLRILRRSRLLIVLTTLVVGALGLGYSIAQEKTYEATSQLEVRDTSQDLADIGSAGGYAGQTPLQLATAHVPEVTRIEVVRDVRNRLDIDGSLEDVRDLVTVAVDPNAYTVNITGEGDEAGEAAQIANAFAQADARISTEEDRANYAKRAARLEANLERSGSTENQTTAAISFNRLQILQSLSATAQPVVLSAAAQVPSSPASPKPVRNTIAAAAIGLLLGLGIAYGRGVLDRRLREPDAAEEIFGYPVLARLRPDIFGHTGSPSAVELNRLGPLEPVDAESVRMLRENVRYLAVDKELKTIAVTSAIPEEGKSTVAACLAVAYASAGRRTLLVECDLRRRVLAGRLGVNEAPGLSDYLVGNAAPGDILQSAPAPAPGLNGGDPLMLTCITAGSAPPRPADLLSSARFADFVGKVSKVYDHVVIDCPPLLPVADTLEVIPHVSCVLMCVRLNRTTTDQAEGARDALARMPARPSGLVITDFVERRGPYSYRDYYAGYGTTATADVPAVEPRA